MIPGHAYLVVLLRTLRAPCGAFQATAYIKRALFQEWSLAENLGDDGAAGLKVTCVMVRVRMVGTVAREPSTS